MFCLFRHQKTSFCLCRTHRENFLLSCHLGTRKEKRSVCYGIALQTANLNHCRLVLSLLVFHQVPSARSLCLFINCVLPAVPPNLPTPLCYRSACYCVCSGSIGPVPPRSMSPGHRVSWDYTVVLVATGTLNPPVPKFRGTRTSAINSTYQTTFPGNQTTVSIFLKHSP